MTNDKIGTTDLDVTSLKYMLRLAAPMVVTTISFTIMQFVDRFMVSRLGTNALAAILPAGFASFLPGGFAIGAMTSLNTFVSQSLGRGDRKACANYYWQAIYLGLAYFVAVVAIMWPMAPLLFKMMGQPPAIIEMEVIYLRIILYAQIIAVVNWASSQFFMGIHQPIITLFSSLCGQVVNIVANYVLIFGKFGFPRLEIAGAGWGTFSGITVAAGINMVVFLSGRINARFESRRALRIHFGKMMDLLRFGLPAGFGLMVNVALWGVILVGLVGRFGTEALAATSAVLAFTSLSIMPVVGMGTALTAAVGKTIGHGKKDLAMKQTDVCLRVSLIYMGLVGLCFFLFRYELMAFWTTDPERDRGVIEAGADILIFAAVYQMFHAARTIYTGALRGAGDTVYLAAVSGAGAIVVLWLGGAIMAIAFPSLGALGPWMAAATSIILVGLANRWRFNSKRWMNINLFSRGEPSVPLSDGAPAE
ncbi:MAG: MATE family efflux transporter [Sedimentisphaerales bacterium]|nr:MATE family efflux transporter [Sedimentisphaerales bacterium]